MNKISIIIPILNEADIIGVLIQYLLDNSSKENISQIVVVNGGSTDGTEEIVSSFVSSCAVERSKKGLDCARSDITLLNSKKGRAEQMNLGAKQATGNILYFLHADSFPPNNFDQLIINEVKKK